jgi:hypothetical protein
MKNDENREDWVWVAVAQSPDGDSLLGQEDSETAEQFIPYFPSKEEGQAGMNGLKKEIGKTYDLQAIHYEELMDRARDTGFALYRLDAQGRVLEKTRPSHVH